MTIEEQEKPQEEAFEYTEEERQAAALYHQAKELFGQKHYRPCLELLEEALALVPDSGVVGHLKGNTLHELGEYKAAKLAYKAAYEAEPCNWYSVADWAYTLDVEGKRTEAIELYDLLLALELEPGEQAQLHYNRADVLRRQGKLQEAHDGLTRAIEIDPTGEFAAFAYLNRGNIAGCLGRPAEARADYTQAHALDRNDANIAWMHWWSDLETIWPSVPQVSTRLQDIRGIEPESQTADLCQGVQALMDCDLPAALFHLGVAQTKDPTQWDPPFWGAIVLAFSGQQESAIKMLNEALDLGLPRFLLASFYWVKDTCSDTHANDLLSIIQAHL